MDRIQRRLVRHPIERRLVSVRFEAGAEGRLDKVLADLMPEESRSRLARHIRSGGVTVDGAPASASDRVRRGTVIEVQPIPTSPPQSLEPADIPLEVLFEDEWLLVVNKPAGLSSHPSPTDRGPTLVEALLGRGVALSSEAGAFRPGIVHRLDKDTSGLLLVAKTDAVHRTLQKAIQSKAVERSYAAFVRGVPSESSFEIRSYLGRHPKNRKKMAVVSENAPDARVAVTKCNLVGSCRSSACGFPVSKLSVALETGRTHQIRVHLASIGMPVVGDEVYGVACSLVTRQALHAAELRFLHPVSGEGMVVVAPLPDDLLAIDREIISS